MYIQWQLRDPPTPTVVASCSIMDQKDSSTRELGAPGLNRLHCMVQGQTSVTWRQDVNAFELNEQRRNIELQKQWRDRHYNYIQLPYKRTAVKMLFKMPHVMLPSRRFALELGPVSAQQLGPNHSENHFLMKKINYI